MTALRRMPLRWRLVGLTMVLVTLALAIAGIVGTTALRGYLLDRVDSQLVSSATGILERSDRRMGRGSFGALDLAQAPGRAAFLQISNSAGGVVDARLLAPAGSQPTPPSLPTLTTDAVGARAGTPFTVPAGESGLRWRALAVGLPGSAGSLTVALSLDDLDSTVSRLQRINVVIGALCLLILGGLGYLLVRESLRPLEAVQRTAMAISAGDLAQRVPDVDESSEIGRLGTALNVMLGQIETAFDQRAASETQAREAAERMRRFVADASHELRTPLTSIRGFAELYRQGAVPQGDTARVLGRIEAEATRMGTLVEDLLLLARLDQHRPLDQAPVDLMVLAADVVGDAAALSAEHVVRLEAVVPTAVVTGDEGRLRQVLGNLVGNAVRHTPGGTRVVVRVSSTDVDAVVEVLDDGPGIAWADQARVFERFYRADPARTRAAGGAGLGLSIVASVVEAHGGSVSLDSEPGRGSQFTVRLPLTDARP